MPNWTMIGAMVLPNLGGWAGALTMSGQVRKEGTKAWYETIKKPSFNPPNWVFGPAWTALYTGMGYASYLVYKESDGSTEKAVWPLALYAGHLAVNWTWTPVFFKYHRIGLAFAHILVLDALATVTAISFYQVAPNTAYFMAPYLAWLSFASLLNYSIWRLIKKENK